MSTRDTVVTAIALTEDILGPHVLHAPVRHRPAEPHRPGGTALLTFTGLRAADTACSGTRRDRAVLGDRLADTLRDRLVISALLGAAGAGGPAPLAGPPAALAGARLACTGPDPMDHRPLAPSLPTLVRFAAATDELAGLRSRFAARAARRGPQAAAEASRRLLAAFEDGPDGRPSPPCRLAALIRPLAPAAGPDTASGLALDLPPRLLHETFGRGRLVRFEEVDLPATLTHGPTRRFLRDTGLPEESFLFRQDTDLPPRTLAEFHADEGHDDAGLPAHADRLVRLGTPVARHSLVVDGATGEVLLWDERASALRPLTTDVSTLAATLWLLQREHTLDADAEDALTARAYDRLVMTMIEALSAFDPAEATAATDEHARPGLLRDEADGVL
ncbi:SUKH-4 family immunity protein [Streptomyces sp. enrichment culture]|uniref:SUKH-4 family immunity protein n=1 Tax=Streptomyces sp. enrichment culture TaxID=1795815 RepID=UPI003F57C83B